MRKTVLIIVILLPAVAGTFFAIYLKNREASQRPQGPVVSVTFLDTQHGAGVIVKTPEGKFAVIDPGPADNAQDLINHLRWMGAKTIDVIITNPTRARVGALADLLESFSVRRIMHGPGLPDNKTWLDAIRDVESRQVRDQVVKGGDNIAISRSTSLAVLSPPAGLVPGVGRDSDDNSLVLQVRFGDMRILLGSDIREAAEAYLISQNSGSLESDIMLLARAGRADSNSLEFISRVRPAYCIVSCGSHLGSPSPTVLRRIDRKNSGAYLYRTDKDGTIEIASDGCRISVDTHVGSQ